MLEVLIGVVIFSVAISTGFYIGRVFQEIKHPEKPAPTIFNLPEVKVQVAAAERDRNPIDPALLQEAKEYEEKMAKMKPTDLLADLDPEDDPAAAIHEVYASFMEHGEYREPKKDERDNR
jgi:hypothetical protein